MAAGRSCDGSSPVLVLLDHHHRGDSRHDGNHTDGAKLQSYPRRLEPFPRRGGLTVWEGGFLYHSLFLFLYFMTESLQSDHANLNHFRKDNYYGNSHFFLIH